VIPDPDRAALIRKAFDLVATGLHNKREVLRMVTNEGLRTRKDKRVAPQNYAGAIRLEAQSVHPRRTAEHHYRP